MITTSEFKARVKKEVGTEICPVFFQKDEKYVLKAFMDILDFVDSHSEAFRYYRWADVMDFMNEEGWEKGWLTGNGSIFARNVWR